MNIGSLMNNYTTQGIDMSRTASTGDSGTAAQVDTQPPVANYFSPAPNQLPADYRPGCCCCMMG